MITMSDDFKKSVSATEREMKGYVEVAYMSTGDKDTYTIDNEPEILAINGTNIDDRQLLDNDRKGRNYASLEEDYFLLDGTFVLPNNVYNKNPGMGYVSKYTYQTQQEEITDVNPFHIICNATDCSGITVYFKNNRPLDLEFRVNTSDGLFTYTDIDITDNGVASVTFNKTTVTDLYIVVNDVLYPNRRLRLQEVDFGLSAIYEGEDLISFKTIEQIDIMNNEMPINEIDVVLGDFESKFDPNNNHGITQFLNENVLIKPYVGVITEDVGIEYCLKGTYWLDSYETNSKQATLKGKDIFSKLQEKDFNRYYEIEDDRKINTDAVIEDFLNFKSTKWGINFIDEHLQDNEMASFADRGYVNETWALVSLKIETLQKAAIQVGGTFNSDRYGNIWYKTLYNENNYNATGKFIFFDTLKEYPKIEAKTPIKRYSVEETTIDFKELPTTWETFYKNEFDSNEIVELYIDLEKYMTIKWPTITNAEVLTSSWSVDINAPEGEQGYYATIYDSYIYMKLRCSGHVSITISGFENSKIQTTNIKDVSEQGEEITITNDYFSSNGTHDLRLDTNALIDYYIDHYKKNKAQFSYNGDPSIECGDVVYVENKYDSENADRVIITKIESEFNGAYSEMIEGDILE